MNHIALIHVCIDERLSDLVEISNMFIIRHAQNLAEYSLAATIEQCHTHVSIFVFVFGVLSIQDKNDKKTKTLTYQI